MSQVTNGTDVLPVELQMLYGPIVDELRQSEEILQRELSAEHAEVDDMIRHGCRLGGKRLRPALLLLTAKAAGEIVSAHLTLAAVVEMIHTATLIHDDVLDEALLRRHLDTCNQRWDNKSSVLLGDYLFTHAFYLASTLDSTFACRTIGKATNTVCEGELRQVRSCDNFELEETDYLDMITAKTAALCACACRLGAFYADSVPNVVDSFSAYGLNLGIAFQIIDDLLDIVGCESTVGKSLGTDLNQQKPTLPLIHVLSHLDAEQRAEIQSELASPNNDGRDVLAPWFERFHTADYVKQCAAAFARQAILALEPIPNSESLETLRKLPEFVLHRSK